MNEKKKPDLDSLLQQWAADRNPEEEELAELLARISAALEQNAHGELEDLPVPARRHTGWRLAAWVSLAVAATLLIAVIALRVSRTERRDAPIVHKERPEDAPPPFAQLTRDQLIRTAAVSAEMERLFEGRLAWFAEIGDRVDFGPNLAKEHALDDGTTMVVRLLVMRREQGRKDWKRVWEVDVVTRSEQLVQLAPGDAGGPGVVLWTFPLPDGKIHVDSSLTVSGEENLISSTTSVQEAGVPNTVFSAQTDRGQYQVLQTVAPLVGRAS